MAELIFPSRNTKTGYEAIYKARDALCNSQLAWEKTQFANDATEEAYKAAQMALFDLQDCLSKSWARGGK